MYTKLKAFIGLAIFSLSLFVMPVGLFLAPASHDGTATIAVQTNVVYAESECGFDNITACGVDLFEGIVFDLSWKLSSLTGRFLDIFIKYSISSQTYSQGTDFVHNGWELVRDMANIFFIFVLLYIAIGTILNLSQVNTQKMLVKVIIVALLINFSLFFTKIVVDASNILARSFIGSIHLTDSSGQELESTDLSVAIAAKFKPQQLQDTGEGSAFYILAQSSPTSAQIMRFTMLFSGAVVLLVMSWTFVTVAFMFLARVITLWIAMITAPLAFISMVLPFNIPKLGHKEWTKKLFESAFMAPVFLFFMYLIIMFLNLDFFDNVNLGGDTTSLTDTLLKIIVPFAIIMALVIAAGKLAKSMSGEIGSALSKVGGVVAGLGAAAITGGAAFAGRATLGRAGARLANSQTMGRYGRALGAKLESSSFDFRQGAGGKLIPKTPTGSWGERKGGYKDARERAIKARQTDAQRMEVNEFSRLPSQIKNAERKGNTEEADLLRELQTAQNSGDKNKIKETRAAINKQRNKRYGDDLMDNTVPLFASKRANTAAANRIRGGNEIKKTGEKAEQQTMVDLLKKLNDNMTPNNSQGNGNGQNQNNNNNNQGGGNNNNQGGGNGQNQNNNQGNGNNQNQNNNNNNQGNGNGPNAFNNNSTIGDNIPKQRQQTPGDNLDESSFSGPLNTQTASTISNNPQPAPEESFRDPVGFQTTAMKEEAERQRADKVSSGGSENNTSSKEDRPLTPEEMAVRHQRNVETIRRRRVISDAQNNRSTGYDRLKEIRARRNNDSGGDDQSFN